MLAKDDGAIVATSPEALVEEAWLRPRWFWRAVAAVVGLAIGASVILSGAGGGGGISSPPDGSSPASRDVTTSNVVTVEGQFRGVGLLPLALSGRIQLVPEHGGTMHTTGASNGHWRITVPPGDYVVEGRSNEVNGGSWTVPTHIAVHPGQATRNVLVTYATTF